MPVTFDSSKFIGAMKELQKEVPLEFQSIMRWQMSLWVRDIIEKIGGDPRKSMFKQRQAGEGLVGADIGKVFGILKKNDTVFALSKGKDMTGLFMVKTESNGVFLMSLSHNLHYAGPTKMETMHNERRNSAGRVKNALQDTRRNGLNLKGKYMVPKAVLLAYIKEKQSHVGRTKACWVKALNYFEGLSQGLAKWQAPAWVTRNAAAVSSLSMVSETFNAGAMTGEWAAGSQLDYGRGTGSATINSTGQTRMNDLERPFAATRLIGIFNKHKAVA